MLSDTKRDVGFKIAKPFFDVNTAGDTDLILNSSWPTLQIAYEATTPLLERSLGLGVYEYTASVSHNLKFPPFTSIWLIHDGKSERVVDTVSVVESSSTTSINSTSSSLSFISLNSVRVAAGTMVHFKCYNVDLSKDIEYPFISPPQSQTSTNRDFGIKMVAEGKSLDSTDMRDYIIHSRCQSPLVLAVKTGKAAATSAGGTISYTSPYLFPSWVFGYVKAGDTYRSAPYFSQAYPITQIVNNIYRVSWLKGAGDDGGALLVLRDPFFSGVDVDISY